MATNVAEKSTLQAAPVAAPARRYAYFALVVLTLANLLNYLDRQILSILAQDIKTDLQLDDAQLGFLMGTAFAVFYAVVGIAMGRISDHLSRTKLMALGLVLWSSMTALGGAVTSFAGLSAARIGVGVGEATANPCSHSLLTDYFPARNRAIVLGTYLTGTFLGGALAMILGGLFLQHWFGFCGRVPIEGACTLPGWKAALIAVGLPGIPLALLVLCLREPPRAPQPGPAQSKTAFVLGEFAGVIPPFTLLTLFRLGGRRSVLSNLAGILAIAITALALIGLTGDTAQWSALGLGAYAVITWGQVHRLRDRPLFALTFGCPTFVLACASSALFACYGGSVHVWAAPYMIRTFDLSRGEIGLSLGLIGAGASILGVIGGGWASDRWRRTDPRGPIYTATIGLLGSLPALVLMMSTHDVGLFLVALFVFTMFGSCWGGGYAALIQDLVLPRMRGAASSAFSLVSIVAAASAGPYWIGKVSAMTGSLVAGMLSMLLLVPVTLVLLWATARRLKSVTPEGRLQRAIEAGEPAPA